MSATQPLNNLPSSAHLNPSTTPSQDFRRSENDRKKAAEKISKIKQNITSEPNPDADEAKRKLKEAANATIGAGKNIAGTVAGQTENIKEAGKHTPSSDENAANGTLKAVSQTADKAADKGIEVGTGLLAAVQTPFKYLGNKISGLGTNLTMSRNETIKPWMSTVALIGGLSAYALAAASSASATIFVTAPALAAGVAALAAIHLVWTIGFRAYKGVPAPQVAEGKVYTGSKAHRCGVEINRLVTENSEILSGELETAKNKREDAKQSLIKINETIAEYTTEITRLQLEQAQVKAYSVAPGTAVVTDPARAAADADQPRITPEHVELRASTDIDVQGSESTVNPDVRSAGPEKIDTSKMN